MTDYEFNQICESVECDYNCRKCSYFAAYQRANNGIGNYNDYERYCLEQEIAETTADCNIGF